MSRRSARSPARPRLPDRRAAEARAGRGPSTPAIGNTAVGRLLASGARVGGSHDAAEGAADRHAAAAEAGRKASGPRTRLDGAPRLGGGRALPGHLMRRLAPHFRSDLRGVRVHTGREVDHAAHSMRAEAFTYGRDVFVRSDKYDPHTRSGRALLRHELAHVDADRGRGRTIRRKTGLPTASEAKTKGGGSGFGKIGKGEWGTYRKLLDKFRALKDKDTAGQAKVLLALTVSSQKMLASTYNAAKKTFVREQMPKIKTLYYQVALKGDVYDKIESEARDKDGDHTLKLQEGIADRMKRVKSFKQNEKWKKLGTEERKKTYPFRMTVDDMPTAPTVTALTDRIKNAKITMNFEPGTLKYFTDDSDVKQFWELGKDKQAQGLRQGKFYAGQRDSAEIMMGYGSMYGKEGAVVDGLRAHRPISCGLNIFDNPKGAAAGYGKWHFQLKDSVKARATYLSGDSLDRVDGKVGRGESRADHIGTKDFVSGVLANNPYVFDALFMEEAGITEMDKRRTISQMLPGDMKTIREAIDFDQYIEVQVHGGISIDDVDCLVVDVPQSTSQRTTKEQIAEGALADAWKAKYKSKARIRWA